MYGSSHFRARYGRGADYHSRLAMTQTGYYRAGGFFSSIGKAVKKAAGAVSGVLKSPVGQVLAPLNPLGRVASFAQGVAGSIPGIGGLVKAGGAVQSMLMPFGKGPGITLPQSTQVAAGALGPALGGPITIPGTPKTGPRPGLFLPPVTEWPKRIKEGWGNLADPINGMNGMPALGIATPSASPGMVPSHVPFGGALGGSTGKKRKKKATSKRRATRTRSKRRRSSARRTRAPKRRTRRTSAYRRGDYGDDWSGNRPSRAKGSGRFLTRRGGRRHHRRRRRARSRGGGRVSFTTKDGRKVSFMPSH